MFVLFARKPEIDEIIYPFDVVDVQLGADYYII
jgi:hypothetical protein